MPNYNFSSLLSQYPVIIQQMPEIFTSHEFILTLARQNQVEYVHALNAYCDCAHVTSPTPFQFVHRILATNLKKFPDLVALNQSVVPSKDIFGNTNGCSQWIKMSHS